MVGLECWVAVVDFNKVLYVEDRLRRTPLDEGVEDFHSTILHVGLLEIHTIGGYYTWSNKALGDLRKGRKIDRCFINTTWSVRWMEV